MNVMLLAKAKKIKMLILDVDGVLTDGRIVIGEKGEEWKSFHVQDGTGISIALRAGLVIVFLSARRSGVTLQRARELGISEVHQVNNGKETVYEQLKEKYGISDTEAAFIGDDLHDLRLLRRVGLSIGVANAVEEIKKIVDYITHARGGEGAVREVIELILKTQGKWDGVMAKYF